VMNFVVAILHTKLRCLESVSYNYLAPGRGTKNCDERVSCLYVCLSVCLSARMSRKRLVEFQDIFICVTRDRARSSDDNRIRYVLPVLWMTSCFPMGPMPMCMPERRKDNVTG